MKIVYKRSGLNYKFMVEFMWPCADEKLEARFKLDTERNFFNSNFNFVLEV